MNSDRLLAFQDEVHFQVSTTITRKWCRRGSAPKVGSAPMKKNVPYSGYVFPSTGELVITKPSWFNYETVIESLRSLISEYPIPDGKKIALVIDNAPWHKKAYRLVCIENREEYSDIREKIELIRLPAYSPDLNPIEQVWRKTRREMTHNRYYKNAGELESSLDEYFKKFRKENQELRTLCSFKHKY